MARALGFAVFDSDGVEKCGHPLPHPSVSLMQSLGNDHDGRLGFGSVSISSVSSLGRRGMFNLVNTGWFLGFLLFRLGIGFFKLGETLDFGGFDWFL